MYRRAGQLQGPYPVCLPAEFASHNLLPDVRDGAIALFTELAIPWHDGLDNGPSNHLRDSQVQCVNALYGMVEDPDRVAAAFGHVVDIDEVLPIEPGRFLTFEFIGPKDYLNEAREGGVRIRGKLCTSVDAAFQYRAPTGETEIAFVEWKYTEAYLTERHPKPNYDATRTTRYRHRVEDAAGPLDPTVLPFEMLLDEPFYQLMRQQLLAHCLECDPEVAVDKVRVLHVLSPHNSGYQQSLTRAEHKALGDTVDQVWARILRTPDRFAHMDPVIFCDPDITSGEYCDRYDDRALV